MIGVVKGGPDQVVHRGINDDKMLAAGLFDVFDAGDEDAGVADDKTAGFDEDFKPEARSSGCSRAA